MIVLYPSLTAYRVPGSILVIINNFCLLLFPLFSSMKNVYPTLQVVAAIYFESLLGDRGQGDCVILVAFHLLGQAPFHGLQQSQLCILPHQQRLVRRLPLQGRREAHIGHSALSLPGILSPLHLSSRHTLSPGEYKFPTYNCTQLPYHRWWWCRCIGGAQ